VLEDGLRIEGGSIGAGTVDSRGDHRIAMSFAVASLRASGPIEILDTANVATSFPGFTGIARAAGIAIEECA
jgi:5-enolpyruvylshikimate-3-phosphate synthase